MKRYAFVFINFFILCAFNEGVFAAVVVDGDRTSDRSEGKAFKRKLLWFRSLSIIQFLDYIELYFSSLHFWPDFCKDTANGATDAEDDDCDWYHKYQDNCGDYDDDDFKAKDVCCACGGFFYLKISNMNEVSSVDYVIIEQFLYINISMYERILYFSFILIGGTGGTVAPYGKLLSYYEKN